MQKIFSKKIPFSCFFIFLFIFSFCQAGFADNTEIYSFSFDWYGTRLILAAFGILLGGLVIKPSQGFFGAIGGGFAGLFVAAWIGNNTFEGFMNFIIMGAIPTAILGGVVGILTQIYKSYGKRNP